MTLDQEILTHLEAIQRPPTQMYYISGWWDLMHSVGVFPQYTLLCLPNWTSFHTQLFKNRTRYRTVHTSPTSLLTVGRSQAKRKNNPNGFRPAPWNLLRQGALCDLGHEASPSFRPVCDQAIPGGLLMRGHLQALFTSEHTSLSINGVKRKRRLQACVTIGMEFLEYTSIHHAHLPSLDSRKASTSSVIQQRYVLLLGTQGQNKLY